MATITKFGELEVWQLARLQTNDFDWLVLNTPVEKGDALRNQKNASSGSVMDNIAEGVEQSGNSEFKNFLVIAKGANGEFRSQLYRCSDREYISKDIFEKLYQKNSRFETRSHRSSVTCSSLMTKDKAANQMNLPPNLEP